MASRGFLEIETDMLEFVKAKRIPADLAGRVLQFFEYRYPDRTSYDGDALLSMLPPNMRCDLAAHLSLDVISASPVLGRCNSDTVRDVCGRLKRMFAARNEFICREGRIPKKLYFIRRGTVNIKFFSGGVLKELSLKVGDVFGENHLISKRYTTDADKAFGSLVFNACAQVIIMTSKSKI